MSNHSKIGTRRLIMPAELLSVYKTNSQLADHHGDIVNQNNEQNAIPIIEQLCEQDDNAIYVLGYN